MLNKNDKIIVEITDYGCNGEGVAKHNGNVVFVPFSLVGEEIEVVIIFAKKSFYVGKIIKIIKASEFRVTPLCEYYGKCGGCNLQHISYNKTLCIKQNIVQNAITHIGKINYEVLPTIASDVCYNYRNKFSFPVCDVNGQTQICMYKSGSHIGIPIEDCLIQEEWCKEIIRVCSEFIITNKISAYNEITKKGILKHIVARKANNQILICFVVNGNFLPNINNLIEMLNKTINDFGLYININKQHNNVILSNEFVWQYGLRDITINSFGVTFPINIYSFMQVNENVQNKIYNQVLNEIINNEIVVNAYSGAGLLSAIIAKKAQHVYGVEIIKDATESANKLIQFNKINNVTNVCKDCATYLPQLIKNLNAKDITLVLDPPRKGCDDVVINAIKESLPNKIIYISCDPSTLSRDLKNLLSNNDYLVNYIQPYDMFPQTKHIETLVCLTRQI